MTQWPQRLSTAVVERIPGAIQQTRVARTARLTECSKRQSRMLVSSMDSTALAAFLSIRVPFWRSIAKTLRATASPGMVSHTPLLEAVSHSKGTMYLHHHHPICPLNRTHLGRQSSLVAQRHLRQFRRQAAPARKERAGLSEGSARANDGLLRDTERCKNIFPYKQMHSTYPRGFAQVYELVIINEVHYAFGILVAFRVLRWSLKPLLIVHKTGYSAVPLSSTKLHFPAVRALLKAIYRQKR